LKQGKRDLAAWLLEHAFAAYQRDPWPSTMVMHRALDLAVSLAENDPPFAARMHEALREPFSVRVLDSTRLLTALYAACQTNDHARCAEAWRPIEPWTPWEDQSLAARRDGYREVH